ncbi:predicted protein [Phaeodactylum tricornutum CCAP 1055/1]|jgi:hypothetical protein|uniref:Uncharacterized protein n=1 Tax=Phaeodactylum tricornutum (strain CCAP 1055/1) TaxID=556484 RepID=B7GE56_PHATC|nr:predicted protein [Phaeodactylum tricornutum CCAP 1055/1]EEC43047.1 predicted protein [Phaeodactylum tricornutum CCAP 1055/1]|eukprot:XP_002185378.1 predicted protein [Phaeodactylum tricornutum CCAP 1055/1]
MKNDDNNNNNMDCSVSSRTAALAHILPYQASHVADYVNAQTAWHDAVTQTHRPTDPVPTSATYYTVVEALHDALVRVQHDVQELQRVYATFTDDDDTASTTTTMPSSRRRREDGNAKELLRTHLDRTVRVLQSIDGGVALGHHRHGIPAITPRNSRDGALVAVATLRASVAALPGEWREAPPASV